MEMNTRLQVEHPVTEAITGVDLVEWQFRAAAGEPVPLKQDQLSIHGWAMEARLYAEDPANGFLPSIGRLEHFVLPDGVRIDTGVEQGGEVSQFYDPMIAKLIVHAETREEAAAGLAEACAAVEVWPVRTNAGFLVRCLEHPRFVAGDVDTGFIGAEEAELVESHPSSAAKIAALTLLADDQHLGLKPGAADRDTPWLADANNPSTGFRLNAARRALYRASLGGEVVTGSLLSRQEGDFSWDVEFDGQRRRSSSTARRIEVEGLGSVGYRGTWFDTDGLIFDRGWAWRVIEPRFAGNVGPGTASDGFLRAPMPGKIVATPAKAGDVVTKGQPVIVLEAMKMEHALNAPFDGVVAEVAFAVGDQVAADAVLAVVEAGV